MRTRVRDNTTLLKSTATGTDQANSEGSHSCVSGTVSETLLYDYPLGVYSTFSDVVVPNFHARSAKGEIFNNPMSSLTTTRDVSLSTKRYHCEWKASDPVAHRHCAKKYAQTIPFSLLCLQSLGAPTGHVESTIDVSSLKRVAGSSASGNVEAPVFAGAIFVAELRETIRFLRNPLQGWSSFASSAFRTKRMSKSLNHLTTQEFVASNWLRYRYGVRPLVSDIHSALNAIEQTVHGHTPERKTARGFASSSGSNTTSGMTLDNVVEYVTETNTTVKVRAGVLYEESRDPDTFGVGVEQIPSAIWEAIPFSFVVDWFVNVGQFIEAIRPIGGIKRLASWTTVSTEQATTRSSYWKTPGTLSGYPRVIDEDAATLETFNTVAKNRAPGVSVGLAFRTAPFEGDLGTKRLIDSLALATQILRSK